MLTETPVRADLIKRVKVTPNQKELTRAERMKNLIGAFKVNKTKEFENKNILIIDDDFTTGATLNEVAKEILKLKNKIEMEGYTLIPLKIYFVKQRVKVLIGLAKGKKNYDKRGEDHTQSSASGAQKTANAVADEGRHINCDRSGGGLRQRDYI